MTRKLFILVCLTVALSAAVLMLATPAPTADAGSSASIGAVALCPNPGFFTGTSSSGNFQDALDAAIGKVSACTPCCDRLVTWTFVSADGREGGFAGFNETNVTIKASW